MDLPATRDLNTLSAVDAATGWVEWQGVWGNGQQRVGGAIHEAAGRLPFPMLGLDSDNGSDADSIGASPIRLLPE